MKVGTIEAAANEPLEYGADASKTNFDLQT